MVAITGGRAAKNPEKKNSYITTKYQIAIVKEFVSN